MQDALATLMRESDILSLSRGRPSPHSYNNESQQELVHHRASDTKFGAEVSSVMDHRSCL